MCGIEGGRCGGIWVDVAGYIGYIFLWQVVFWESQRPGCGPISLAGRFLDQPTARLRSHFFGRSSSETSKFGGHLKGREW